MGGEGRGGEPKHARTEGRLETLQGSVGKFSSPPLDGSGFPRHIEGVADTHSVSLEEEFNVSFGSLAKGDSRTPSWAIVRLPDLVPRVYTHLVV